MCNIDRRCTHFTMQLADLCSHADTKFCIQIGQWLIHQKYLLIFYDCTPQCHSLSLTSRKILRFSVTEFLQSQDINCPVYFFLDLVCWHLHVLQPVSDIFFYGHMRIQSIVLEYHRNTTVSRCCLVHSFAVNIQISFCNLFESGNHTKCCGFSTSRRSYKCDKFFFFYIKIKIIYRFVFCSCIFFSDMFKFYKTHNSLTLLGTS